MALDASQDNMTLSYHFVISPEKKKCHFIRMYPTQPVWYSGKTSLACLWYPSSVGSYERVDQMAVAISAQSIVAVSITIRSAPHRLRKDSWKKRVLMSRDYHKFTFFAKNEISLRNDICICQEFLRLFSRHSPIFLYTGIHYIVIFLLCLS